MPKHAKAMANRARLMNECARPRDMRIGTVVYDAEPDQLWLVWEDGVCTALPIDMDVLHAQRANPYERMTRIKR